MDRAEFERRFVVRFDDIQPTKGAPPDAALPRFARDRLMLLGRRGERAGGDRGPDLEAGINLAYYEPTNQRILSQGAYALVNATFGYQSKSGWGVDLWARNLADKQYLIATASNGATYSGQPGDPRTYGIRASLQW